MQPAVEQNRDKIQNAIKQLEQQLKAKLDQRSAFVEKYGLNKSSNKEGGEAGAGISTSTAAAREGAAGVLV